MAFMQRRDSENQFGPEVERTESFFLLLAIAVDIFRRVGPYVPMPKARSTGKYSQVYIAELRLDRLENGSNRPMGWKQLTMQQ
jgi:hypothetical protein